MSQFSTLTPMPADALLGLMTAYREDPRDEKFDLGVGVYKNDKGETPVMSAVAKAEALILKSQTTKEYEGPRGNTDYCAAIEGFVFGEGAAATQEGRTLSFTAPGGCGALFLGTGLMSRMGVKTVWVSNPTWPNHPNVVRFMGLDVAEYPYADPETGELDLAAMLAGIEKAERGDGIIIQGPCHNPTGIDLTIEDWKKVGALVKSKGLIAMLDVAYHGFAKGLDEDVKGVRAFIEAAGEALVSYSCSKNFGLYRERAGCFLAVGESAEGIAAASTHVAALARASYSMPPAHGAAIVATILNNADLRAEWEAELTQMRERMISLRKALAETLVEKTGSNRLGAVAMQNGMFSQLPLSKDGITAMREKSGLYMPNSGRINIAGLNLKDIPAVADIIAKEA